MNGHISACFDEDGTRVCGFDEHPEAVGPEACSLDAAWADAEAALPEGWCLRVESDVDVDETDYVAAAGPNATAGSVPWDTFGVGPTPAAALRWLAAKLRDAR